MAETLSDALYQAVDVLRHCVADGPGCDDAAARRRAIEDGEAVLRAVGHLRTLVPNGPITEGYGVTVRTSQVRAGPLTMMDEHQVWATSRQTGRACISGRFTFKRDAETYAADLRATRKATGKCREDGKWIKG